VGSCFAEDDLYTTKWDVEENVDIERFFFGRVDTEGKSAVEFFSDFQFDDPRQEAAYHGLMKYISVQKLRTPKGLGWLSSLPSGFFCFSGFKTSTAPLGLTASG
jgi:hypothetical protein